MIIIVKSFENEELHKWFTLVFLLTGAWNICDLIAAKHFQLIWDYKANMSTYSINCTRAVPAWKWVKILYLDKYPSLRIK